MLSPEEVIIWPWHPSFLFKNTRMKSKKQEKRRLVAIALATGSVLLLAAGIGLHLFRDLIFPLPPLSEVREGIHAFLNAVPGPLYFLAFATLPAVGMPLTFFWLTAIPVLGGWHPVVGIVLAWTAMALNIVLSRVIAGSLFRPVIERLIRNRHLDIPKVRPEGEWQMVLAVRLSPVPFILQNYLLALGRSRWRHYLGLSVLVQAMIGLGVMLVGESILKGGLGYILLAVCLVLVLNLVLQRIRKSVARSSPPDES